MNEARPLPKDGSVQEAIRNAIPWLSPALRRIADLVLDRPDEVAQMTNFETANAANVSTATVTRFCSRIGLDSYQDFVRRLAREAGRNDAASWETFELSGWTDLPTDYSDVPITAAKAIMKGIRLSADHLVIEDLELAAERIAVAPRVDVYGSGGSGSIAQETELRLFRLGVPIRSWNDVHGASTSACLLRPGDVAIAVSDSGLTEETYESLRLAQESGAFGIAITCDARSPLAALADVALVTPISNEEGLGTRTLASRHAQLFIIDCLYIRIAQLTSERVDESVQKTKIVSEIHTLPRRNGRS